MKTSVQHYTEDHRHLLDLVARQAGFTAPVAIDADEFYQPLLAAARREEGRSVRQVGPGRTSRGHFFRHNG